MFLKYETSLRDPLYNYIPCTDLELNLIDTKAFQRLKRISQTSVAKFVYPGAEHTRFPHSLGAMHLAGKMAEKLLVTEKLGEDFYFLKNFYELCEKGEKSFPEIKELSDDIFEIARKIEIVRIAALFHDLGHCGFSHTLEPILMKYQKVSHEEMTIRILEENDEIRDVFEKCEEAKLLDIGVNDIIKIYTRDIKEDRYLCEIISGTFDVDKTDYIARDAHHTGTIEYGAIDSARLTESMVISGNTLIPDSSVVDAVIDFWEARFHMFSAVYYHRAARAMDIIIRNMIEHFIEKYLGMGSKRPKTILSSFIEIDSINDYLLLDDCSIISELNRLRREGYKFDIAFRFLDMYLKRKPLTLVDEYRPGPVDERTWKMLTDSKKLETMAKEISKLSDAPKHFVFVDAPPEVKIGVSPVFGRYLRDIEVYDKKEKRRRPIGDFDAKTVEALSTLRGMIRIYTLEEYADAVKKGYEEYEKSYLKK